MTFLMDQTADADQAVKTAHEKAAEAHKDASGSTGKLEDRWWHP
ncbi:MAG TPA: hypothetical protein VEA59_04525 [Patescibacteria group bacterium]|nr:hypothetical protein [Patescibacteria group bacterium]